MEDLGALLREMRLEHGIGLDRLAQLTGKSKGHLSRIERGERPVNPALVLAYERALGVRLPSTAGYGEDDDSVKRRDFLGSVIAISSGGASFGSLASSAITTGSTPQPTRVGLPEVIEVEEATQLITSWDLRHGGRLAVEQGRSLLRWCVALLDGVVAPSVRRRLVGATSYLADRTAWASYDSGQHELASKLFKLALHLATDAHDPNLRAQVVADMSNQQIFLREPTAALTITAVADDDKGMLPEMRASLEAVKAEAYGALGEAREMRNQIAKAERAFAGTADGERPNWMGAFRNEATMHESAGNALYSLAIAERGDSDTAIDRLTAAAAALPTSRTRACLTCAARLGVLHFSQRGGDLAQGVSAARQVICNIDQVRSVRLNRDLRALRAAMARHQGDADVRALVHEISWATEPAG